MGLESNRILEENIKIFKELGNHFRASEDELQDIYEQFLRIEDSKLVELENNRKLQYYIYGIFKFNLHSTTSVLFYRYKKRRMVELDDKITDLITHE